MDAYQTFLENKKRVENFISMYESASKGKGRGRRDELTTDILRAGVVFTHAALEEYLRTLILNIKLDQLKSQNNPSEALKNVSLPDRNSGRSTESKYKLCELAPYSHMSVGELLENSLREKIGYMTFNNYEQVCSSLKEVGISLDLNASEVKSLNACMQRRHKIVHEADKNPQEGGRGNYRTKSINADHLKTWLGSVDVLVGHVEQVISKLS